MAIFPKWSSQDDAAILAGLAAGVTNKALAARLGRTCNAVNVRVSYLRRGGINIEAIKAVARGLAAPRPRGGHRAVQQRDCLGCTRPFASAGAHNRLCAACRYKSVSPYAPGAV